MKVSSKKIAVVSGASSGIGYEVVKGLLKREFLVYGISRSEPKQLVEEEGFHFIPADLSDLESLKKSFETLPTFQLLINNAGVAYASPVIKGCLSEWEEMWSVNVRALAYLTHSAVHKLDTQNGQIINISSMSGHRVPPSGGFYAATKFAVRAITEATRAELKQEGSKIRVSSISPGFVETPLLDTYFKGREADLQKTKETMPMLSPEDIAHQVFNILETPQHVEVGDISLKSSSQTV